MLHHHQVLYFTVASELFNLPEQLRHLHIFTASSKGDRNASIILPHLFYYQSPGFTPDGGRLIWKEGVLLRQEESPTPKEWHTWPFHGYHGYTRMPTYGNPTNIKALPRSLHTTQNRRMTIASVGALARRRTIASVGALARPCRPKMHQALKHNVIFAKYGPRDLCRQETSPTPTTWHTRPVHNSRGMPTSGNPTNIKALPSSLHKTQNGRVTIAFVGDLGRSCRPMMHQALKHNVIFANYGPRDLCSDPSVPGGLALCWRSFMLQADINLAPIGSAPVSYRLFEALQQGSIPVHVYDQRGVFLPYAGTDADIRNDLGFVVPFAGLQNLTDWLQSDAFGPKDVTRMRQKILKYRDTHFTPQGVVLQLKNFFESGGLDGKSDIRCCLAIPEGLPCG